MDTRDHFEPVRPRPLPTDPGALKLLRLARRDLLSFWSERDYQNEFAARKFLRRWVFIANSPDTVEHVFVTRNDRYERKSPYMRKSLEPLLGDGLFISEGETWQARRELEEPAFSSPNLRRFASRMAVCALELGDRWMAKADDPVPMLPEMACLTAEIIGRTMFGQELGTAKTEEIVRSFAEYQAAVEQFDISAFFGLPDWFPRTPQWRRARRAARSIHDIVDELLQAARAVPPETFTLFGHLLKQGHGDSPPGLSPVQMRNEATVIFMAGHETTANVLAWAWYLLASDPRAEARLHAELAHVLGKRTPEYDDVAALKYTRAVIEEAMRLYPPVPILSRECLSDDVIRERRVPAGSVMLVVPWLLHRHAQFWDRPHQFVPERFMPEWPRRHPKFSYIPFSVGPRNCLGAAFGLMEAIICLAVLAQRFAPRLAFPRRVGYECRLTLRPAFGLPMKLAPRD